MPTFSTYPDHVHTEQQHIIGEEHQHRLGSLWDYVEFTAGTYREGQVVIDQPPSNFASGTVTRAQAVGTNVLQDTGEFAGDDLRGAIGTIMSGGGAGQIFQVISHDDDELLIRVHKSRAAKRGWEVALTTSSTYTLRIPGRVALGAFNADEPRGVVQYKDPFTVPTGEFRYGYVRKTGIGEGLFDVSDNTYDLRGNGFVQPGAGGLIVGMPSAITVMGLSRAIGKALFGNPTASSDVLIPINFNIVSKGQSFRRPKLREEPKFTVE